jgi:hypothetical protein
MGLKYTSNIDYLDVKSRNLTEKKKLVSTSYYYYLVQNPLGLNGGESGGDFGQQHQQTYCQPPLISAVSQVADASATMMQAIAVNPSSSQYILITERPDTTKSLYSSCGKKDAGGGRQTARPLAKLTVDLIKTYKGINEVW